MRILVIEDDTNLNRQIKEALTEADYAVDVAFDGEEGYHKARSISYDVIILDLMLPKLDGLSVLKTLRQEHSPGYVLVLTAKDTSEDKVRGLELGADDYLVKPFDFPELLARVKALVRRKYEAKSTVLRVADLEVDTSARVVRRGGQLIDLSGREYALLEYLALNAGRNCAGCNEEFFPEGHVKSNFLCNLGYGDPAKLHPRAPRLAFEEACTPGVNSRTVWPGEA